MVLEIINIYSEIMFNYLVQIFKEPQYHPMDMLGAALTMVCVLSERRLNRLNNPALALACIFNERSGMFLD